MKPKQQQQKPKLLDPWPAWDSPGRIKYPDRPELPEDVYRKASQHFTAAAFEQVKAALKPPRNFDLLTRLRRAAFDFHFVSAAQAGKIDLIEANRPRDQARALDELINQIQGFLQFCEGNPGAFLSVADPPGDWVFLLAILEKFRSKAEAARRRIKLSGTGPARDMARRVYQSHLLKIFEAARREPMTSRTASAAAPTDPYIEKPYGPAFDFFSAGFELIGLNLGSSTVNKYLKDTIRKRDKIISSKLFQK